MTACTCQYGNAPFGFTPYWYVSVKRCPVHSHLYAPQVAPEWVGECGPGGLEVLADKASGLYKVLT